MATTTSRRPSVFTDTNDPYAILRENRQFAGGRGEALNQQLEGRVGGAQSREDAYRDASHQAYEPLLNGFSGPGYSPEEQRGIIREDEFGQFMPSQDDFNQLYLTPEQQNQIMADPYSPRQFVRPDYQNAVNNEGIARQREAGSEQGARMREAIDPNQLRLSGDFRAQQNDILNGSDAGVRGAITDRLRMDGGFDADLQSTIDANRLRQDPGFADKYRMTEQNVQGFKDRAARNVANQKQNALDEIEQRAVASGATNPLAMGALRSRYENNAQVNAADAAADAELGARKEQANRELNIETNRQDAERGYSGLASSAKLSAEGLRQAGERSYAGMKSDAEMRMGDRRSGVLSDTERMRLGAEQGLTDRRLGAEQTIGDNRLRTEAGINQSNLDLAKYQQDSGANIFRNTGADASQRAAQLATNGQGVGQYNIDTRYGQGMARNNALSQRNAGVADGRRQDMSEGRGWLQHNVDQSSDNVNKATDQQLNTYNSMNQALGSNAGDFAQYDLNRRGQGFGAQFKSAFAGALGAGIGKGLTGGFGGK